MDKYQPKGSMCFVCEHRARDCSKLPFHTMLVIDREFDTKIVKCTEYKHRWNKGENVPTRT